MGPRILLLTLCLGCGGDPKTDADSGGPAGAGDSDSSDGSDGSDGGDEAGRTDFFPQDAIWYQDISDAAPDPDSDRVIAALQAHGWGLGRFQIDFSIRVLDADASSPVRSFTPTGDFYSPDCDEVPVPIPDEGGLEGESGYACENDGDCHLIARDATAARLYEMWRADIREDGFFGGCLAVWDLSRTYGPEGRGLQCTSAGAAGYPIAALLFSADEVAAGEIPHAIRFILPNSAIRAGEFVAPATHSTGAASGGADSPPYGAHLRLRADYPLESLPSDGARVVARALQRHGMFLADGGNVALTARSDQDAGARWEGLLGSRDLEDIEPQDFELMPMGTPIPLTYDCQRVP